MKSLVLYTLFFAAPLVYGIDPENATHIINEMTKRPWTGKNYPSLPSISTAMSGRVTGEMTANPDIMKAVKQLNSKNRNNDWFDGITILEKQKAVWSLQAALCHPNDDVQIKALQSLKKLNDPDSVPFLLTYAEYMAVFERGSENATLHGIVHQNITDTLSVMTGIKVKITGQQPEELRKAIRKWTIWSVEQQIKNENKQVDTNQIPAR